MKQASYWISIFAFLIGYPSASTLHAAQLKKVRLAFSALAYANPPFWIAHELKLFEKYGLDSELIYVGGSRTIQAMLGGSIDASQVDGAAPVATDRGTVAQSEFESVAGRHKACSGFLGGQAPPA